MDPKAEADNFAQVIDFLALDDTPRTDFLKACLTKLGLRVNQEQNTVPSLSRLHLTSLNPLDTANVITALQDIITKTDDEEYIKDENDTFHLEKPSAWRFGEMDQALAELPKEKNDEANAKEDSFLDYNKVVKRLVVHDEKHPTAKETPYFNHSAFFANLRHYQEASRDTSNDFGKTLLYGEVVTSTNTLLEKCVTMFSWREISANR